MIRPSDDSLSLSEKLTRLFEFFHARTEPELTHQAAAIIVGQRLGRLIDPASLDGARRGEGGLPADVRETLCELFGIDHVYLSLSALHNQDTEKKIQRIDRNLLMWTLARDRGLKHLAARCGSPEAVEAIIRELEMMPPLPAVDLVSAHRLAPAPILRAV
jgi:hypothetical protein